MTDIPEQGQNQTPREARQNHLASLRMRLQTAGDLPDLPAQEALWLINEINTLEGAIELLKEDRTQAADALTQATDALEAQAAQHKKLADEITRLANDNGRQRIEIERLRAVLGGIAAEGDGGYWYYVNIAREALKEKP